MPTYVYACKDCGHTFEAVQAFSDDALTTCPNCSGPLRKVFNSVGIVFKGSGFYRTDSRSGGSKESSVPTGSSSSSDSSSPDSTSSSSASSSSASSGSGSASTSSSSGSGSKSSTSSAKSSGSAA